MAETLINPAMNKLIKSFLITKEMSIKDAMRQMGKVGEKILFVVNEKNQLIGSLTDGDVRRWVLAEGELNARVAEIYYNKTIFVRPGYEIENIKQMMLDHKIEWIPVLNQENQIIEILLWDRVFGKNVAVPKGTIDIPVVIMAGGKGTRLDPFTKILPKPLIPIGDKAIIEVIMDKFNRFGISEFFVSVNHKSHMIRAYFDEINTKYKINFIEEDEPLGTAGSLTLMKDKMGKDVLVSNCDIIIETDYEEIVNFHRQKKYDITIVGSFRHFKIPYGICKIENGGKLTSIEEKPEYDFLVNTGMYVINKNMLDLIPKNKVYHITDLINKASENNYQIGVFPIDEKSWIDVGQWEEYHKSVKDMKL